MHKQPVTPQEKLTLGYEPSAADIQVIINDPNHWMSKLLNECLLLADINEWQSIEYARLILREHKLETLALKKRAIHHLIHEQENEISYYAELYQRATLTKHPYQREAEAQRYLLASFKQEMAILLDKPQQHMSVQELAIHHQQVTANFNNQIAATLGANINVPVSLNNNTQPLSLVVPQLTSRPIASTTAILERNHALPATEHVVTHTTLAGMGYLAVLNKWREILEFNREELMKNGVNVDDIQLTPHTLKRIDNATQTILQSNPKLLLHVLENNALSVEKTYNIANRPTLFSTRLTMKQSSHQHEEEDGALRKSPLKN